MSDKRKPNATVIVKYYDDGTEVKINGFERLTPGKIQRSLDFILKEWHLKQQRAVHERRRSEEAKRKEQQDAA